MAHGITEVDSMADVNLKGTPPWHFFETEQQVKIIKALGLKTHDMLDAARLTWEVEKKPLLADLGSRTIAVKDRFATVRLDTGEPLGVVGKGYTVLQNEDAMLIADDIIDSSEAHWVTAGSLHRGASVWGCLKLPTDVTIGGHPTEKMETFLLVNNTHDGSGAFTVSIVTVRVVCQNTLSWALNSAQRTAKIRHTKNAADRWTEARRVLQIGWNYTQEMAEVGDRLANTSFSDDEFQGFLNSLVPLPEKKSETEPGRAFQAAKATQNTIDTIYRTASDLEHLRGTQWGALQAVVEYNDHHIDSRKTDGSTVAENRFKRIMGIGTTTLSSKAFSILTSPEKVAA